MKKQKAKSKEVSHVAPSKQFGVWNGRSEDPKGYLGRVEAAGAQDAERKALDLWNVRRVFVRELGEREFPKGPNFGFHPNRGMKKDKPEWNEWRRRFYSGISEDNRRLAAMQSRSGTEDTMSKDKSSKGSTKAEKSDKTEKKEKTKPETTRQNWNGHGMCEVIRFCGSKGFGPEKTGKIVEAMSLEANPATIKIQLRKGKNGENVPEFSKDHRSEFNAIANDIPNDAPKAKKTEKKAAKKGDGAKAEKSGKTAKKSDKKTMKKHQDEDADAEAQAEADAAEEEEDVEVEDEVEEEVEA